MAVYPKTLLPIAATVGGLALFLIFASLILVSQPFGSSVRGYFDSVDRANEVGSLSFGNGTSIVGFLVNDTRMSFPSSSGNGSLVKDDTRIYFPSSSGDGSLVKDGTRISFPSPSGNGSLVKDDRQPLSVSRNRTSPIADSGCDLYDGKWVYDPAGPLYSNDSCPVLTQMQNCQGNGRPDKDYENWRWKPTHCDLPRFDPRKFLELMRGKTLAYVGDSVARNHMESMLCILWQAEVPKNRGNKKMQRFYFRSTSTTIIRIWSSWLVRKTTEAFDFAPAGVDKLHLDAPDENFMVYVPKLDILVLSSGHWFMKRSVYIVNNTIAGGQLWWPDKSRRKTVTNVEAFEISVETIVSALVTHPNYTGLTVVRSYSPDHYEGGSWNTGGSCTGKVRPAVAGEVVESGFTNMMHDRQVSGVGRAVGKRRNGSRVRVMDVTRPFSYRHDGHPGPYRNRDPNKVVKRAADGRPPPQDCLHWCMPGPIDTWNEMLFEVIRRDFEGVDT